MKINLAGVDPIPREAGLFPGLQKMPWEKTLLSKLIEDYQFEEEYAIRCMEANRHNHITATYHLIDKKSHRNRYMRETFSTHNKKEIDPKRDRMQSQGAPKPKGTIDLAQVKPPARKFVEEDMNQTMRVSDNKKTNDVTEVTNSSVHPTTDAQGPRRATTLEARDVDAK